jgi:hypothetical protein
MRVPPRIGGSLNRGLAMSTKNFTVGNNKIVNNNHTAIRGIDSIQITKTGEASPAIHAYLGGQDQCTSLVGQGNCPIPLGQAVSILILAPIGTWQLGADASNDGGSGQSSQGPSQGSNGELTVGSG